MFTNILLGIIVALLLSIYFKLPRKAKAAAIIRKEY